MNSVNIYKRMVNMNLSIIQLRNLVNIFLKIVYILMFKWYNMLVFIDAKKVVDYLSI